MKRIDNLERERVCVCVCKINKGKGKVTIGPNLKVSSFML